MVLKLGSSVGQRVSLPCRKRHIDAFRIRLQATRDG